MKKPIFLILVAIFASSNVLANVGDRNCSVIVVVPADLDADPIPIKVCGTILSENNGRVKLKLDSDNQPQETIAAMARFRSANLICKALGYNRNVFLGAKAQSSAYGQIVAGNSRGKTEWPLDEDAIKTFSQVTCK